MTVRVEESQALTLIRFNIQRNVYRSIQRLQIQQRLQITLLSSKKHNIVSRSFKSCAFIDEKELFYLLMLLWRVYAHRRLYHEAVTHHYRKQRWHSQHMSHSERKTHGRSVSNDHHSIQKIPTRLNKSVVYILTTHCVLLDSFYGCVC